MRFRITMMKITVISIGKLKEKFLRDGVNEYIKRLQAYCKFREIEIKENPKDDIEEEGRRILDKIPQNNFVVTLEIEGKSLSSEAFAKKMSQWSLEGKSAVTFIIGGSSRLSNEVRKRGDYKLSFSNMTFTHQMMRLFLLEQIYRCFKINAGETYHK